MPEVVAAPAGAITEPGIYEIDHAAYLADPVETPSLNCSIAKLLVELSPAHARAAHPRFNAQIDTDASEAQDVGSAAHSAFLQGIDAVVLVDVDSWRTKAAKEQRAEIVAAGKIALKRTSFDAVLRITDALERFRQKTGAFTLGQAEQTLVWNEGPTWCRCKVDWLPDEPSAALWDLKTTGGRATLRDWTRQAYQLGTDMQASFYPRGAECVRGEPPDGMNFCVVETEAPFGISVFSFSPAGLEVADAKVRYAIRRWTHCMEDDHWPGYPVEPQWVEPPVWILREWEGLTATGEALRLSRMRAGNADNLAGRIAEAGSFG